MIEFTAVVFLLMTAYLIGDAFFDEWESEL